jgi:LPS-assembly lipoprotein
MKPMSRIALMMVLTFFMGGCGYHLRGSIDLPEALKHMYLFGASSSLHAEMVGMLRTSKSKMAASPNEAGIVIKIMKEDITNRTLSIGSTGKSNEVELNYYLRFQFFDKHENPMMDEQTIELTREYFNDQTSILAKDNEALLITKEIYKQAARMLFARAQIAIENQK